MATRSRVLAWRIPRTEEAGGLQSCVSNVIKAFKTVRPILPYIGRRIRLFFLKRTGYRTRVAILKKKGYL